MPRRNLLLLVIIGILSIVCYRQADSSHRSEHGRMYDTFSEVLRLVDDNYLREVDNRELFEGALAGMMSRLDRYSEYIGPEVYPDFRSTLGHKFGGIGVEVSIDATTHLPTVMTALVDMPAYEQGVRAGDTILKIDGADTQNMSMSDLIHRLRGQTGAEVHLTILHKGETEPFEVTIHRKEMSQSSVVGAVRDDKHQWSYVLRDHPQIGYIRIASFGIDTVADLKAALARLTEQHVRGLILDLRYNPGGLLDGGIDTCRLFLNEGRIVSTRGRSGVDEETWDANGSAPYADLPLVVLVNQYTASAAEIVAACLQDHDRAIIVGERTWGKGTVQHMFPLEGGESIVKLTTATYWRPSGKDINRHEDAKDQESWGVQPNAGYEVALPTTEEELPTTEPASDGPSMRDDPQLKKAVEALEALLDKPR